jgi:hypothetical protein
MIMLSGEILKVIWFLYHGTAKTPKDLLTVLTVPSFNYPSEFYPRIQPYPFRRPSSSLFLFDRQPVIFNQHLDPGLGLIFTEISFQGRKRSTLLQYA